MGRKFRKTYLAIVAPGAPEPAAGRDRRRRCAARSRAARPTCASATPDHPDAETALSRYRTLADERRARRCSSCGPRPAACTSSAFTSPRIGRPIAGDARYGGALTLAGAPVPRLMLHAAALEFPHPDGGSKRIEAPLPDRHPRRPHARRLCLREPNGASSALA